MTIYKGKNVDEAIEKGLAALNLKKNEVHINIIEKGQAGVFGFFEKEAEVEITPLTEQELKIKKYTPYLIGAALLLSLFIVLILAIFQDNKTPTPTTSPSSTSTTIVEKTREQTDEPSPKETSTVSTNITTSSPSTTEAPATSSSNSNKVITIDNNEEFNTFLQTEDQNTIKDFIQKYKGQTIEFDGNIANLAKIKSKYNILIRSGDYHLDEAIGPNFQFFEISLISNPVFNPFNGENIREGQNVHIKAKVGGYNKEQGLVYLSPIEVSPR